MNSLFMRTMNQKCFRLIKGLIVISLSIFAISLNAQNIYFKHYTAQDGLAHNIVFDIHQDNQNYLWIATNDGLSRFNGSEFINYSMEDGLADNAILNIESIGDTTIFISQNQNIQTLENHQFKINPDLKPLINKQSFTKFIAQNFLLDTIQNKLLWNVNDEKTIEILQFIPIKSRPTAITTDHENHLWIATEGDGVYMIYLSSFANYGVENGLDNTFVHDILEDKNGNIWAGTKNGFYKFDNRRWQKVNYNQSNIEVWKYRTDNAQQLYASTNKGIFKISSTIEMCLPNERTTTSFIIDEFNNLSLLRDGFFWIYNDCDTNARKWIAPVKNANLGSYSLFEDRDEQLWVGTSEGVFYYKNLESTKLSKAEGLPSNIINDIVQDSTGNIWLATEGGLVELKNHKIKNIYSTKNGLLSNQCRRLCIDPRGGIWIATPRGLHYLNNNQIIPYNEQTGLSSSDVNALFIDKNKQLWVATSNGIARTSLSQLPQLDAPPTVNITQLWLDGQPVSTFLKIPHSSYFQINFEAITFSNANQLKYQYRLNDHQKWQPIDARTLTFSNLQEGKYNFQLRAKKINSPWSNFIYLPFEIRPPFWRSWWFFVIIIGLIIAIAAGIIKLIRQQERQKTNFNKQLAELELQAIQAQMNPHFIFNALNAIQDYVVKNDANAANKYLSQFAKLMRLFLESSHSKYITLGEEIKLLKLYVSLEKVCYEEKFDYEFEFESDIDEDIEIPAMFIQPFVENAIRHGLFHAKEKGNLLIQFSQKEEQIICKINDNGIGRAKAKAIAARKKSTHKSRGMEIIEQRQTVFNDLATDAVQFDIRDLEQGTEVELRFLIE